MRYIAVNGARVSTIGLGTWQFGSKDWGYGAEYAETEASRILHRALDLGVNVVDTAEVYARNESERIVGRAIASRRADVFLATKVLPVFPIASTVDSHGRASAERLGVEQIDLYQIHWPNPAIPISEQMRGMRRLLDAGIIAHAGVSNFSLGRWKSSENALGSPVLSNQVQYSLAVRKPDRDLVPYAAQSDRLVIAYSPLAKGLLSGKYDATNLPKNRARMFDPLFLPENVARAHDMIESLRMIAKAHDATPSQVALAWVISHPNVIAIPGASSVAQLEANVAAADLELSADDTAQLDAVSDAFQPVRGVAGGAKMLVRSLKELR
jgi:aryl-alcohol dehydrogenase-like predicted oxidoreductase